MAEDNSSQNPLLELDETSVEFILQFVLTSGSLKEMARVYEVSYPTLRARLDRLIERLQALLQKRPLDPMALLLGDLVERGELSGSTARAIHELHRKLIQERKEN